MSRDVNVVVLAAGKGTRMKSKRSKVLQKIGDKTMLSMVLDLAFGLVSDGVVVVVGHDKEAVTREVERVVEAKRLPPDAARIVEQTELKGTASAIKDALGALNGSRRSTVVLYGDVPLIGLEMIETLLDETGDGVGILSAEVPDPTNYGRIVRNAEGEVVKIVEHADADENELAIHEINTGIMVIPQSRIEEWVLAVRDDNAKGEYYVGDVVPMALREGARVVATRTDEIDRVEGANDRAQLAFLWSVERGRRVDKAMRDGLVVEDPDSLRLLGTVTFGSDVRVGPNVSIEGVCELGDDVVIEPNVCLRDVKIGSRCVVGSFSHLDSCELLEGAKVGPFARLRPGAVIGGGAKIGNFVEIKASTIGPGSKIGHLTYVGDATVGKDCNIGAGVITCNYDGVSKWRTSIGDGAFIGCNTLMVAPVSVGSGATTGAGTVVTRDCPERMLTVSRTPQRSVPWKGPDKK